MSKRQLKIFLCHSSGDKPAVRALYKRLRANADYFSPWLDEEDLLPGQRWEDEIPKAVRESDAVIVCLSKDSINKRGYVQKEILYALNAAEEQPEGSIFLIPVRLEDCELPERLKHLHRVDLYDRRGFETLLRALNARAEKLELYEAPRDRTFRLRGHVTTSKVLILVVITTLVGTLLLMRPSLRQQEHAVTLERETGTSNQTNNADHIEIEPIVSRGVGKAPKILIDPNAPRLQLELLLLTEEYEDYLVELKSNGGATLARIGGLRPTVKDGRRYVSIIIHPQEFTEGYYLAKLFGIGGKGNIQSEIANYPFIINSKPAPTSSQ